LAIVGKQGAREGPAVAQNDPPAKKR
jgi:hypothetical protein